MVCGLFGCFKWRKRRRRHHLSSAAPNKAPLSVLVENVPSMPAVQCNASILGSGMADIAADMIDKKHNNVDYMPCSNSCEMKCSELQETVMGLQSSLHEREKLKSNRAGESSDLNAVELVYGTLEDAMHDKLHLDLAAIKAIENSGIDMIQYDLGALKKEEAQLSVSGCTGPVNDISCSALSCSGFSLIEDEEECIGCNQSPIFKTYVTGDISNSKYSAMLENNATPRSSNAQSVASSVRSNAETTSRGSFHGRNMADSDSDIESQVVIDLSAEDYSSRETKAMKTSNWERKLSGLDVDKLQQDSIVECENDMFSDTQSTSSFGCKECHFDSLRSDGVGDTTQHQTSAVRSVEPSISLDDLQSSGSLLTEQHNMFMQEITETQEEMTTSFPAGDRWSDDQDSKSPFKHSHFCELADDAIFKNTITTVLFQSGAVRSPVGNGCSTDEYPYLAEDCLLELEDDATSKQDRMALTAISSLSGPLPGHLSSVVHLQSEHQDQPPVMDTAQHNDQSTITSTNQLTPLRQTFDTNPLVKTPANVAKIHKFVEDRPILGTVAAHWSHSSSTQRWWDGKGIPNSTNKYKEDQKVSWHATPFEIRLERALAKQDRVFQKKLFDGNMVTEIDVSIGPTP